MADNKDAGNLKIAQQLAAAIERQQRALEASTRALGDQAEIIKQVTEAVNKASDGLGQDPVKKADEMQKALRNVADEQKNLKSAAEEAADAHTKLLQKGESNAENFAKAIKKAGSQFPVMKTAALAATHGILEGFRAAMAMTKGLIGVTTSLVSGLGRLGVAILSIPFKIFQGLIDKAESGGGGNELAAAYEAVRKQFGSFKQEAAHNVIETARTIDKEFTQTGLSTWRVFGNLADRLNLVRETAEKMGAVWDVVGHQFAQHAGHILAYQKGLGLSAEDMKDLGQASIRTGKSMEELGREIASFSLSMQKQLGGSAKLYSRDVGKMINDVKHFGGISVKVMTETAVYTRKLGIETEKLLGMMDKFDSFEDAATSAAKLAQTYGANVDAFKLMNAESPAEQLDMIRKAMFEAGKSTEDLGRKDFKYISSLTGLDEKTVAASLSLKNQGVSMDKVREAGVKAEKQQLSQAEAMSKLADAIERLTPSGGGGFGGFIKALIKGFSDGIEWSEEFRTMMMNIRRDMYIMYQAGRQLGMEFVKAFPGVKQLLGGLRDLFDPAKFQKLADGLVSVIGKFFRDMTEKPKVAFPELMKALKTKFFDFFNLETGAGSKIVEGFKKFMLALGTIAGGGVKFLMDSLRDGFKLVTDLMNGKGMGDIAAGASGAKKFIAEMLTPIWEGLKEAWPSLKDAFIKMVETAWEKIKASGMIEKLWGYLKTYILGVGAVTLGSGLLKGTGSAILGGLAKGVGGVVTKGLVGMFEATKKETAKAAAEAVPKGGVPQTSGGMPDFGKIFGEGGLDKKSAKNMSETASELQSGSKQGINFKQIGAFLLGIAGVIAIGMVALWAAVKIFGDVPIEKLAKGLMVIGGATLALLPAAAAVALISKVKVDPENFAIGMLAIAAAVAVMVTEIGLIYAAFNKFNVDYTKLSKFTGVIVDIAKVFLVAGLVVGEAMLIGAAITATSGLAGGAALAGFAAIGTAVAAMTSSAIGIMKELQGIEFAAGLGEKVDMFVKVLTAVTTFAKTFGDIISSMQPSFIQVLRGDDTTAQIDKVTNLVREMIGQPGGGGIMGLVDQLSRVIKDLSNGGEQMLKAGDMLANLLSAVGQMATAMTPSPQLYEATGGLFKSSDATGDALSAAGNYVRTMEAAITGVIDRVQRFISEVVAKKFSDNDVKQVQAIAGIFPSIVGIVNALKPDASLVDAAKNAEGDVKDNVLSGIGDLIVKQGLQVRNAIDGISTSLSPIVTATKGLDAAQLESLKAFAPLLSSVFTLVTGISGAFTGILLSHNINVDMNGRSALITRMTTTIKDVMSGISETLPDMINSLKDAIGKVNIDKASTDLFKQKLGIIKSVMEVASSVPALLKSFSDDKGAMIDTRDVPVKLWTVHAVLKDALGEPGKSGPLVEISKRLSEANLTDVNAKKIELIKNITENASRAASSISSFPSISAEKAGANVQASLTVIGDMVKKVNELSDLLSNDKLMKIDIAPKLENLAKTVGLGGKGTYSIEHKPVTITVNLTVQMDAKQIDHALVDRKGTSIQIDQEKRRLDI